EQLDCMRCVTPDSQSQSPVCLPLDELHRLHDKLQRHSRAEEVALKRIRDLEMQLNSLRRNQQEVTAERDVLQERMEEQLVKISALQSRLDEQRCRADGLLKETNMELEARVRAQEVDINTLRETLDHRDNQVKTVKEVKKNMEEMRRAIVLQEKEWSTITRLQIETLDNLKTAVSLKIKKKDGASECIGHIIPIRAVIELLMGNKDAQIAELQRQLDELNKLLDHVAQYLDPEKCKETKAMIAQMYFLGFSKCFKNDLKKEVQSLEGQKKNLQEAMGKSKPLGDDDALKLRNENIDLKGKLKVQMQEGLEQLRNELDEKNIKIADYERNLSELNQEIKSLRNTMQSSEAEKQNYEEKITEIQQELHKSSEKLREKESEMKLRESHQQQNVELREKCLEETPLQMQEGLEQLRNELDEKNVKIADYERNLSELNQEIQSLRNTMQSSEAEKQNYEEKITEIQRELNKSSEKLREKESEMKLRESLQQQNVEIFKKDEIEELRSIESDICNVEELSAIESKALKKILEDGINSLSFNELALLHHEICKTTYSTLNTSAESAVNVEVIACCPLDKSQQLYDKIVSLEHQLVERQTHAHNRALESDIWEERKRVEELKQRLEEENKQLVTQTQSYNDLQAECDLLRKQISYQEQCIQQLKVELERERAQLHSQLLEKMRLKLEAAMGMENKLRLQLEQQKFSSDTHSTGSCPAINTQQNCFILHLLAGYQGKLEAEQERCKRLEQELRREQGRAGELEKEQQLSLHKIEIEKEMDTELHRQKKTLSEQEEMDKNRQALLKAQSTQYELEQKIVDLELQVATLKQQLVEKKLQDDKVSRSPSPKTSSPVLEKLKQQGFKLHQFPSGCSRFVSLLSHLTSRVQSVNILLEQHMSENAEVALTLSRLTEERQKLLARVRELEGKQRSTVDKEVDVHATCAAEKAIWIQEKTALKLALAQAEADAVRGRRIGDGADTDDRLNSLSPRQYLRAESYRKALIWQKRYLLVVLGGYQESEAITVSRLAQLSGENQTRSRHTKPRTTFRTVAIVAVALSRMRYMVRRWRLGRRIGSGVVLNRGYSESALSSGQSSYHGARRRGSSTSVNSVGAARFGPLSPPSRDLTPHNSV
ncbi:hypothetical protein L9F63_001258, partial [Diploptera punctata]